MASRKRALFEPTDDWQQLQLQLDWPEQHRYELIRPVVVFGAPPGAAEVWREIEVAANQTLADLGNAIPLAFDFDDPHLWSFFFSGKAWDRATEYALHSEANLAGGPRPRAAGRVQLREAPFP